MALCQSVLWFNYDNGKKLTLSSGKSEKFKRPLNAYYFIFCLPFLKNY